tara:strand:+ start:305 stop:541 length:237 start_codon:yes stop_codon:yes gene_type:complete
MYPGSGLNKEEWQIMSRCNEFARMASPGDGHLAESLAVHWFSQWREKGVPPRESALKRCPNLFNRELQQRITKFRRGF